LTLGFLGDVRISIEAAPWTIGTAMAVNQTVSGGFVTLSRTGFAHDVFSGNTYTLWGSSFVRFVTPMQVTMSGVPANYSKLSLFSTLTLFIPEPGWLLSIGAGIVGLALLGHRRMRG
jgi:hypothetical protein